MADEKTCFVIAPIGEIDSNTRKRSDLVLKYIIGPAAKEAGYKSVRADQIDKPGLITSQVIQHIANDDLVIADLTERNPNVFYELAVRHAIRKPLVQIIKKGEQIPFDVAGTRTIYVDHTDLDSVEAAKVDIISQIKAMETGGVEIETPISVSVDLLALRQSENPEDRSRADLLDALADMRVGIEKLESKFAIDSFVTVFERFQQEIMIHIQRLCDVPLGKASYKSRRHRENAVVELSRGVLRASSPARLIVLCSYFRDFAPWVRDLSVEIYRSSMQGNMKIVARQVEDLMLMLNFVSSGVMPTDNIDDSDVYLVAKEIEACAREMVERGGNRLIV